MNRRRAARHAIMAWNVIAPLLAIALIVAGYPWWWGLALVMGAHALWLIPTLIPACAWCGEVVTTLSQARGGEQASSSSPPKRNEVWLTIDDGPDPEDTPRLLDLLDAHQAKATFFFIGAHAEKHPGLVREVIARGHEVANHTMHHVQYWFWAFGPGGVNRELQDCQQALTEITGTAPRWFRAPAGLKNPFVQAWLEKKNMRLAGWSARGLDGVVTDPERVIQRLFAEIRPGCIILMHEGRIADNGQHLAPQVLERLLTHLHQQGFRCVLPAQIALRNTSR